MANGSFGLSGFPTAPTTSSGSSGGENNALSAVTVPVTSASGYSTGDLVYFRQGDYGNPSGSGQTGGLILQDPTSPVFSGTTGSYLRWPGVQGANRGGNPCAKLTDGNTVFVYYDITSTYPNFIILDSAGTQVVAPTVISSTFYSTSDQMMGVVALTGGGFAVSYIDNRAGTVRMAYAIYTNAGAVTTAPSRDTSITVTSSSLSRIAMVALPNGGFAVAVRNSGNNTQVRFYSATTQLGSWTTPTGLNGSASSDTTMSLLARADSSVVLSINDATSAVVFNISSSNVTLGSGRLGASGTQGLANMTAVLLADNSVAVFGSVSTTGLNYYNVTGTTSATWGSAVTVNETSYTNNHPVAYLTSAGNVLIFNGSSRNPQFQFCSTAGASLTGGPYPLIAAAQVNNGIVYPGFIENGSTVSVYWSPVEDGSNTYQPLMTSMNVDSSTYALQSFASTDGGTLATSTAVSLAGYNRANSTPTGASFFSAGSGSAAATSTTGTTLVAQTVIESTACDGMSSASLSNGGCVILYKQTAAPYTIKYAVFSKTGVLQTTVTVANGVASGHTAKIAVLSDGKICVIYYNSTSASTTNISFAIYSTSYALLNSGILAATNTIESPNTATARIASLAALPDGYFVVLYPLDGLGAAFRTYTNTGAAYSAEYTGVGPTTTSDTDFSVSASLDGSVAIFWKNSTTGYRITLYKKTIGSNVYTLVTTISISGTNVVIINRQTALCPDGGFFFNYGDTNSILRKINLGGELIGTAATAGSGATGTSVGLGVTGSGMMISYNMNSNILYYYNATGTLGGSYTLTLNNAGTSNSNTVIAGSYGNNAFIGIMNSSNYPTYTLVSMGPVTYPLAYNTATPSAPLTASPATGYYLVGVATTDCAPGGTGTVQINGSASLNSSYPSGTTYQAFDFSNPTLFGVKGTVVGRNISMQGNV